ncbi:MAG: DNA topoisomerase I, partial [Candidatus Colwellbacteria bacterium]|nr:DNA topoisomerase I [Candidatus Colwellbacteria bacterium]
MDLVIVESPTKAKTIGRFLGAKYRVESSYGHIRDLPKGSLGIDVENGFAPQYVIPTKSRKRVNELKRIADSADRVILATDEDREGEAIAWHLAEALGLSGGAQREVEGTGGARGGAARRKRGKESPGGAEVNKVSRIVFHEITERAISESLKEPRGLNMHLVLAQQARRILDRLVGYKLSPFLWKKIMGRLSAGRVQSAALRLIVERERAIRAFTPVTYF